MGNIENPQGGRRRKRKGEPYTWMLLRILVRRGCVDVGELEDVIPYSNIWTVVSRLERRGIIVRYGRVLCIPMISPLQVYKPPSSIKPRR